MYVQRNKVALSRNHRGHGNTTIPVFIFVDMYVTVNNINWLILATERQQWVPFTLLSRYKILCTAV